MGSLTNTWKQGIFFFGKQRPADPCLPVYCVLLCTLLLQLLVAVRRPWHLTRIVSVEHNNQESWITRQQFMKWARARLALNSEPGRLNQGILPLLKYLCSTYTCITPEYFFASFSVASVSHDDEAKLNRERRSSVTGGIQGNGEAGGSGRRESAVG